MAKATVALFLTDEELKQFKVLAKERDQTYTEVVQQWLREERNDEEAAHPDR